MSPHDPATHEDGTMTPTAPGTADPALQPDDVRAVGHRTGSRGDLPEVVVGVPALERGPRLGHDDLDQRRGDARAARLVGEQLPGGPERGLQGGDDGHPGPAADRLPGHGPVHPQDRDREVRSDGLGHRAEGGARADDDVRALVHQAS